MINGINDHEQKIVRECLTAAARGRFFPDWEFDTLFGLTRREVESVLGAWPNVDSADPTVRAAVVGSLGHLLGYPHGLKDEWNRYISVDPDEVRQLLDKLVALGL